MRQEFWLVLAVVVLICLLPLIAVTLGPREDPMAPIVHAEPASNTQVQEPVAGVVTLPEDGMYQEVRLEAVCIQIGPRSGYALVARTPGSVTPVSMTYTGVGCD